LLERPKLAIIIKVAVRFITRPGRTVIYQRNTNFRVRRHIIPFFLCAACSTLIFLCGSIPAEAGVLEFSPSVSTAPVSGLNYAPDEWPLIKQQKENNTYRELSIPELPSLVPTEEIPPAPVPPAGIGLELPMESRLSLTGRKLIGMSYSHVFYLHEEEEGRTTTGTPAGASSGFDMNQELQVKIKGNVGEKINVDVDWDDTRDDPQRTKIHVKYTGTQEEVIQNAEFGDVSMSLPSTEFVSYSKNVFGLRVDGHYEDFKFMGVGSQTKGITDVKRFKGQTTFEKRDISDNAYVKYRYYKLHVSTGLENYAIVPGSEQMLVDDRDSTNNASTGATAMAVLSELSGGTTYFGNFHVLNRGEDYVVDYVNGIVTFRRVLGSNHVVAVKYKYLVGDKEYDIGYTTPTFQGAPVPVMLKDESGTLGRQLKNYYDLGHTKILRSIPGKDFVLKIFDLNRTEMPISNYPHEIDYDTGLLRFTNKTPFQSDVYNVTNPGHHNIIYVEYYYRMKVFYLKPNIVTGSDRVLLNGEHLERDTDYIIDYYSGYLEFLDESRIDEEAMIEITYEYYPFIGQGMQTLLGLRGEWKQSDRFHIGSTFLGSWSPTGAQIPEIRAVPSRKLIFDVDTSWTVGPAPIIPLTATVQGEYAHSSFTPNSAGKAMLDDMEGAKIISTMPGDSKSWRIAANPGGAVSELSIDDPMGFLSHEDVKTIDMNPNANVSSDDETRVLGMDYDFAKSNEISVIYPVSSRGADYSKKNAIELFIKGEGNGTLEMALGDFKEDADNDGKLDSEDKNINGSLDSGEDIGWEYLNFSGQSIKLGEDNGQLDTEDLDGDGFLTTADKAVGGSVSTAWTSGWQKIVLPLPIAANPDNWTSIKQIRLTLKSTSGNPAKVWIGSLSVVGNKWEMPASQTGLEVLTKDTEEDTDYEPLWDEANNPDYDAYKELYRGIYIDKNEKEQSLVLQYSSTLSSAAYVSTKFSNAIDYSDYKELRLFVHGDNKQEDFYIEIGADQDNMFHYREKIDWSGWKLITIKLEDENRDEKNQPDGFENEYTRGAPSLSRILEIRFGIIGNGSEGEVWINDIHLSGVDSITGQAYKFGVDTTLPGWFDLGGSYRFIDKNFQTMTTEGSGQDKTSYGGYMRLKKIAFMPLSFDYRYSEVVTPKEALEPGGELTQAYISTLDEGKVSSYHYSGSGQLNLGPLPKIGAGYTHDVSDSDFERKQNIVDTYDGSLNYSMPLRFFLFPDNLSGGYKRIENETSYLNPETANRDFSLLTQNYSGAMTFTFPPLKGISLSPGYSYRETKQKDEGILGGKYEFDKSKSQAINAGMRAQLLRWLNPNANASIDIGEDYLLTSSTAPPCVKNVNRSGSGKVGVPLNIGEIVPWFKPFQSLNVDGSYGVSWGDIYENVPGEMYILNRLKIWEPMDTKLVVKSRSERYNKNLNGRWTPLGFIGLKGWFTPFGTISLRTGYSRTENYTVTTETPLETYNTVWPDISSSASSIEKLPLLSIFTQNFTANVRYRKTLDYKVAISSATSYQKGVDLRLGLFKFLDCSLSLSENTSYEENFATYLVSQSSSTSLSSQVKFTPFKRWWLILKYGMSKSSGWNGTQLTSMMNTYSPGIRIYSENIQLKWPIKIPFFKKELHLTQDIKFDFNFATDIKRSELNIDKDNTNLYKLDFSTQYALSNNMHLTLGGGSQYYHNLEVPENDYISVNVNGSLVITF